MFTRRAIRIGVATCVPALVAAASVAASAHPRPQAGAAFTCDGGFHQVSSPSAGTGNNALYGVTAISSTDAWAVGYRATTTTDKTLILHWNGSKWLRVTSPNAGGTNRLYGVAAVSATDVWAVGFHLGTTLNSVNRTLTEHWDGATWTVAPSPNAKVGKHASPNQLNGVTVSGTNVLAAGYTTDSGNTGSQTLLVGNPGSGWSILGSGNAGDASWFFGIDAPPSGPVWEVGRSMTSGNTPDTVPLIARGTSISVGPAVTGVSTLGDVEALSSTDAWAVGFQLDSMSNDTALIAHYNGSIWAAVGSAPSAYPVDLSAVSAVSATDVYAVGHANPGYIAPYAERWNGSSWSATALTDPGTTSFLWNLATLPTGEGWAVGQTLSGTYRTLIERACGL